MLEDSLPVLDDDEMGDLYRHFLLDDMPEVCYGLCCAKIVMHTDIQLQIFAGFLEGSWGLEGLLVHVSLMGSPIDSATGDLVVTTTCREWLGVLS